MRFNITLFYTIVIILSSAYAGCAYSADDHNLDAIMNDVTRFNGGNKAALNDISKSAGRLNSVELSAVIAALKLSDSAESVAVLTTIMPSLPARSKGYVIGRLAHFKNQEAKALASGAIGDVLKSENSDSYVINMCISSLVICGDPKAIEILARYFIDHPGDAQANILNTAGSLNKSVRDQVVNQVSRIAPSDISKFQNILKTDTVDRIQGFKKDNLSLVLNKLRGDQKITANDYQAIGLLSSDPNVLSAVKDRFLKEKDANTKGNLIVILMQVCSHDEVMELLKENGPIDDDKVNKVIEAYKEGKLVPH